MRDTSRLSVNFSNDLRNLMPAIIGGVILGEALWSLIQLVLRNWAAPALINLLGQGPTQNQNAFLLQPLLIALVEACFAGIILVLLMAWSSRRSRTVRAVVEPAAGAAIIGAEPVTIVPPTKQAARSELAPASAESRSIAPTSVAEPKIVPAAPAPPATREVRLEAGSSLSPAASTPVSIIQTAELSPLSKAPATVQTGPSAPPRSKKPKKVYYNIVGEPIESDD